MKQIVSREQLLEKIKNAKKAVRIVGTVAFALPFDELIDLWYEKINNGTLTVCLVSESEATLSYNSLLSSNRRAVREEHSVELGEFLKIRSEPLMVLKEELEARGCAHLEPKKDAIKKFLSEQPEDVRNEIKAKIESGEYDTTPFEQNLFIKTCYMPIPVPFVQVDDEHFITYSLTKFNCQEKFEKIDSEHPWFEEFDKYFYSFLDAKNGAQKYCSEMTKADDKTEIIQMYSETRQPLGQLPRDSFLDCTRTKLVIWCLLFTRDGKILIHQRSKNAKDNRGMWDKSVGGHVDIVKDIDSAKAASRELGEELFKQEKEGQGGHNEQGFSNINENKLIYLGEWRPEMRSLPFADVVTRANEYYYFRMDYEFSKLVINSPRHLPDGRIRDVKTFVDLYVCIAAEDFKIDNLKNSQYKLLELHELKDYYKDGFIEENGEEVEFKVTPDLKYILDSERLWENQISAFVSYLKYNMKKK
ncbi:MAG: NUDIX domain-containing protein [Clostridia bacterium]|nr:NUDIX domain-containing protein [Clostridia bacterium]